jgi:hypothetical protein
MLTRRQKVINLDVEMTKNLSFSVSYHPKVLETKEGEVFINPSKYAGKYVGIFYTLKRINTASTKSIWQSEFISGESEDEVSQKFQDKFNKRYNLIIENNKDIDLV